MGNVFLYLTMLSYYRSLTFDYGDASIQCQSAFGAILRVLLSNPVCSEAKSSLGCMWLIPYIRLYRTLFIT